jgi:glucokinase
MNKVGRDCYIGIDLGGTKMLVGAVDKQGKILNYKYYTTGLRNQRQAFQAIMDALDNFIIKAEWGNYRATSIGIGVVGQVDLSSGYWNTMYKEGDRGIPLAQMIKKKYGLPCGVNNDVKAATIAEKEFGIGTKTDDFIYINIGTGIAAGFVCNGRLLSGLHNNAGEIGHMVVDVHSDILCSCGKFGCVEAIASGRGILMRCFSLAKNYPESPVCRIIRQKDFSPEKIFAYAEQGDKLAKRITDDAADAVSTMIMNLIATLDPEQIVLSGGMLANKWLFDKIKEYLIPQTKAEVRKRIVLSKLDPCTIGLIGAAILGFKNMLSEMEKKNENNDYSK